MCSLSNSYKFQGFRQVYELFSERYWWAVARSNKKDGIPQPMLPESTSIASTYVIFLKSAHQAKTPCQIDRTCSQHDWECVPVCCLCSTLGVVACQEFSSFVSDPKDEGLIPLGHQNQMLTGHSLCGLCWLAGFGGATVKQHAGVGHSLGHHWQG